MFADVTVLLAENENDLQCLINTVNVWCMENQMSIDLSKTKIMHIRKQKKARSSFIFKCDTPINYCYDYKYLGAHFNEFLTKSQTVNYVASSARKLSSVWNYCTV